MKSHYVILFAASLALCGVAMPVFAQPAAASVVEVEANTTTVTGQLRMPSQDSFAGVDREGLSLADVVVRLEGSYERVERPHPENWREMSDQERLAWIRAFEKSEAYQDYLRLEAEAKAARPTFLTTLDEDGAFTFEGIGPDEYTLQALIMHPDAGEALSWPLARAYKTKRFTIEDTDTPVELGAMTMWLRNVLLVGEMAPEWTGTAYDGSEVKLSDFRGKYVLLDFWATWCGPCLAEVPNIEAVYADYGGEHFEVVGLSLDPTIDMPRDYHAQHPSPYVQAYLGKWNEETTTFDYGINGIPSIWLIGPDGRIVARDLRGLALREAVRLAVEDVSGKATLAETETETD